MRYPATGSLTLTRLHGPAQLTDFAGASKPSIPMCSLSDLTSFSFGDIVSKLKLLFEARFVVVFANAELFYAAQELKHRCTATA